MSAASVPPPPAVPPLLRGKVPTTVVTGFLGAGKTSLLRHLIDRADGRRIALVINEFGDLGVDREILDGCGLGGCAPEDVVELANGCICCTVADDFLPTLSRLLDRPDPPEAIVIETSGLALPKPLLQAFAWPDVRARATVDGVVTVVDLAAVAAGTFADDPAAVDAQRAADPALDHDSELAELFADQLACADLVVFNKTDLVDPATRTATEAAVRARLRAGVRAVAATHGRVDPAVLLGLAAAAEDDLEARPSHHDGEGEDEHGHDAFASFVLPLAPVDDPAALEARIVAAFRDHPILRIKGFVDVAGKPSRHVVQAVGGRVTRWFDRPWGAERQGALVVIGEAGLDPAAVAAALAG